LSDLPADLAIKIPLGGHT